MDMQKQTDSFEAAVSAAGARAAHKKNRFYRPAVALLGLLIIALAVVGVIALARMGITGYQNSKETLKEELTYFISPLAYYTPAAFDDVNQTEQDALILSAIYKLTEAERIRQLQQNDLEYAYEIDEYGRLALPLEEVEKSYASLYGEKAKAQYRTIGETDNPYSCYEFNAAKKLYYAPADSSESLYDVFVDTVTQKGDTYTLDVCYVPESHWKVDNHGNVLPPTRSDAQYIQKYTLLRTQGGWQITAVADSNASTSTTESTATEAAESEEETTTTTTSTTAASTTTTTTKS